MASLDGKVVRVAGAGALGLSVAVELAEAGADVTVFDPSPETSASAVAAGMLAPVFEAVLDPSARPHFALLMAARDAWPGFAARTGIAIDRGGAIYIGEYRDAVLAAVANLGVSAEIRPEGLFVGEDWRLDAPAALTRLKAAAVARGVGFSSEPLADPDGAAAVAATGWRHVNWAPESSIISPIKGQLLMFNRGPSAGAVERWDGGYNAPGGRGAMLGATMQPGLTDLSPDDALPQLARRAPHRSWMDDPRIEAGARVGIRGATPDGLPLVGPSVRPGVWLAMGGRRNGWLLAPLVAAMTRAYLAGEDPGPWAPNLDARRFTAPEEP